MSDKLSPPKRDPYATLRALAGGRKAALNWPEDLEVEARSLLAELANLQRERTEAREELAKVREENRRLRADNTVLLEALMDMVGQHFYCGPNDAETRYHSHMSADEGAIEALIDAGFAEEAPTGGYRLLWSKLNERKSALAGKGGV